MFLYFLDFLSGCFTHQIIRPNTETNITKNAITKIIAVFSSISEEPDDELLLPDDE